MTKGFYSTSWLDYNGEVSNTRFRVAELNAGNYVAQAALRATLTSTVQAIVVGELGKVSWGNEQLLSVTPPVATGAQRELKWLVSFHDATTFEKYRCEIPCPDTAKLDPDDRGHANIGDAGDVDAFVAAFEAYILSDNGNAVVIDEITLVGRPL